MMNEFSFYKFLIENWSPQIFKVSPRKEISFQEN